VQLAGFAQRVNPAAHVAERNRISSYRHVRPALSRPAASFTAAMISG
jgi:hypothetical protein